MTAGAPALDVARLRVDFPCLHQSIHGRPLVFLDTAASAQKPAAVIDAMARVLRTDYANIHRGVYDLSQRATDLHEGARAKVQRFLGAAQAREIVFTRNATEGINLVAESFVRPNVRPGDRVVITAMEHHANIVPWQMLRDRLGLELAVAPMEDDGSLCLDRLAACLTDQTRLLSVTWVSNALGTVNPVHDIVALAHGRGIPVLLDAAQAVQHMVVDVQEVDCDFLVFSSHKLYGPSGIGVLYGKADLLEAMPPYQGGGEMIASVTLEHTEFADLPYKFEAGTPAIEAAVGLGAAIDYVDGVALDAIAAHEADLLAHATRALQQIPGLRLVGTAPDKCSVLSFVMDGLHPQDIGVLLDLDGIAIRTGQHCAQPAIERLGHTATARASLGMYNTHDEIDARPIGPRRGDRLFGSRRGRRRPSGRGRRPRRPDHRGPAHRVRPRDPGRHLRAGAGLQDRRRRRGSGHHRHDPDDPGLPGRRDPAGGGQDQGRGRQRGDGGAGQHRVGSALAPRHDDRGSQARARHPVLRDP
jgi:cysteine desulfurase/selenocysteine lyase